jgi:DNA mismatch repair ATPase MutS
LTGRENTAPGASHNAGRSCEDTAVYADLQTLADLEMAERPDGAPSVAGLFDKPRSAGGKTRLRALISEPMCSGHEIRAVQGALKYILSNLGPCNACIEEAGSDRVERYLTSRIAIPAKRSPLLARATAVWTSIKYPECISLAQEGIAASRLLVKACKTWGTWAKVNDAPPRLHEIAAAMCRAAEQLGPVLDSTEGAPSSGILERDRRLRSECDDVIGALLHGLYDLDALIAMAETGQKRNWVFPEILPEPGGAVLALRALTHPLLKAPIANDFSLGPDAPLALITGPNMAGKTTFMKSIGLSVYLAQLGMQVPAASMQLRPFERVITSMGATDTVASGCSYFLSELRRLQVAVSALEDRRRCLLLFDEVLRGTNSEDALEASVLVARAFASCENSVAVISSHAVDLVAVLAGAPAIGFYHFSVHEGSDGLAYDYDLRPGSYTGRMAMALIAQEGLLAALSRMAGVPSDTDGPIRRPGSDQGTI